MSDKPRVRGGSERRVNTNGLLVVSGPPPPSVSGKKVLKIVQGLYKIFGSCGFRYVPSVNTSSFWSCSVPGTRCPVIVQCRL